ARGRLGLLDGHAHPRPTARRQEEARARCQRAVVLDGLELRVPAGPVGEVGDGAEERLGGRGDDGLVDVAAHGGSFGAGRVPTNAPLDWGTAISCQQPLSRVGARGWTPARATRAEA